MGWMVWGSKPGGGKIFCTCPHWPLGPPSFLYSGFRSFLGIKRLGHGIDHPPPSSAEVKERVDLYLNSTSGRSWPILGWPLPLPFTFRQYSPDGAILSDVCCTITAVEALCDYDNACCSDVNVHCALFQKITIILIYRCISAPHKLASI
jgi:hypothetical protein